MEGVYLFRGIPKINYSHRFINAHLWGSYSPINGDSFVWEIDGVDKGIFQHYLNAFSQRKPEEYKIILLDNAGFHNTKSLEIPPNISFSLLRIPPYSPELNPCEQIWQYMKKRFKNKNFDTIDKLKEWLYNMVNEMDTQTIKSIVSNHHYLKIANGVL